MRIGTHGVAKPYQQLRPKWSRGGEEGLFHSCYVRLCIGWSSTCKIYISFSAKRISLFTSIRWSKSIELSTLQPLDLFPSLWHFHNGMHEQNQGKFPTALYPVRFITRTKIASSVPLSIETYFSIKHREKKNSENRRVAQMQRTPAKGDSVQSR